MLRFVVTGCARSSTLWTAHSLTRLGLATGHEAVTESWDLHYGDPGRWRYEHQWMGDSCWSAAPFVKQMRYEGVRVVHLVRDPLLVVQSMLGVNWLDNSRYPFVRFINTHAPHVLEREHLPTRCLQFWVDWNLMVSRHSDLTWTAPMRPANVKDLFHLLEIRSPECTWLERILDGPSANGNKREAITPEDFPQDLWAEAQYLWAEYQSQSRMVGVV